MYQLVHVLSSIDSFFYRKNANYLLTELSQTNYTISERSHLNVWTFVLGFWCVVPCVYEPSFLFLMTDSCHQEVFALAILNKPVMKFSCSVVFS